MNMSHDSFVSNEVNVDLYMFHHHMLYQIGGEVNRTDVVTVHKCCLHMRSAFHKKDFEAMRPH